FEIVTKVSIKEPSQAQLVFINKALQLAELMTEAPDEISEITKSSARSLRKLRREGAEVTFADIFVSTRSIKVLPVMAQRQFTMDPRIKALLNQTAPSINV